MTNGGAMSFVFSLTFFLSSNGNQEQRMGKVAVNESDEEESSTESSSCFSEFEECHQIRFEDSDKENKIQDLEIDIIKNLNSSHVETSPVISPITNTPSFSVINTSSAKKKICTKIQKNDNFLPTINPITPPSPSKCINIPAKIPITTNSSTTFTKSPLLFPFLIKKTPPLPPPDPHYRHSFANKIKRKKNEEKMDENMEKKIAHTLKNNEDRNFNNIDGHHNSVQQKINKKPMLLVDPFDDNMSDSDSSDVFVKRDVLCIPSNTFSEPVYACNPNETNINKLFIITKLKTNRRDSDPFTPIREQSVLDKCLKLAKLSPLDSEKHEKCAVSYFARTYAKKLERDEHNAMFDICDSDDDNESEDGSENRVAWIGPEEFDELFECSMKRVKGVIRRIYK